MTTSNSAGDYEPIKNQQGVCPHCGRCPHCGQPYPQFNYPYPITTPQYPWNPIVYCTSKTGATT